MGGAVEWQGGFAMPAKGADFVEANDVIDMLVRVENMIDCSESFAESLFAKVGAGIDEKPNTLSFEEDGGAGATITGIGGSANRAVAADDGNPNGGSCA